MELTAKEILDWLEKERNILQNTGSLMWHKPDEQAKTLDVAKSLDTTIKYIKFSLFPESKGGLVVSNGITE